MENMGMKLIRNHTVVTLDKNRTFQKENYLRLQKYYSRTYKYNCCTADIIIQHPPGQKVHSCRNFSSRRILNIFYFYSFCLQLIMTILRPIEEGNFVEQQFKNVVKKKKV